LQLELIT
jgi:hypothetical protein